MERLASWQIHPAGRKSALWCDGCLWLWTHGEAGIVCHAAATLAEALEQAARAETLWIAPTADEWLNVQAAVARGEARGIGRDSIDTAIFPKGLKGELAVQLLDAWVKGGVPSGASRGRTLARGLYLAADLLGVRLRITPSHSGRTLMLASIQEAAYTRRGVGLDMAREWKDRIAALTARTSGPLTPQLHYGRAIHPDEQPGADSVTLYSYDRNMSFVSSAGEVPTGEPSETREYLPGQLGAYRVNAAAPAAWPAEVPGYIGVRTGESYGAWPREVTDAWVWSHQLRAALAAGWQVEVLEGFAWGREQKHAILKPWSEAIWSARLRARALRPQIGPAAELAEGIIKQCGVAAIGGLKPAKGHAILTSKEAKAKDARVLTLVPDDRGDWSGLVEAFFDRPADLLYQPAWWATTVSLATERLIAGCVTAGTRTLAAYVDGIFATAPVPALAGEATKRGGWRYTGEVRYDRADLTGAPSAIVRNLTRGVEEDA